MAKKEKGVAYLGKDARFEGRLKFYDTIRIDGQFFGEILGSGTLIVGDTGYLESDVRASSVIISGEIKGKITADQRIEIHVPARVMGDLQSPSVVIDDGVVFEGNCKIRHPDKEVEDELDGVSERGVIFGVVIDTDSGDPIRGAVVRAWCKGLGKKKTKTDEAGYYELSGLENGVWELENKSRGYEKLKARVEIKKGGRHEYNFK